MAINEGQPDPIINRKLSDACWNGDHRGASPLVACPGYRESGSPYECLCHSSISPRRTSKREQANATMNIMETGCGTIEVK
jgi:hypothetical protein